MPNPTPAARIAMNPAHSRRLAFVATIYGVAFANLLFLPVANKLKSIIMQQAEMHEMIVDGLTGIANGDSPRLIEIRLQGYLEQD